MFFFTLFSGLLDATTPSKGSVPKKGIAIWFTGLPGSGKSSICDYVLERLKEQGYAPVLLRMDERRKVYFPNPQYTSEEREKAYHYFAWEGIQTALEGNLALMDATAPRIAMRTLVRQKAPRFAEIHISCSLDTAMKREQSRPEGLIMADLYQKALQRQKTGEDFPGLGQVIGVDVPFEVDPEAELILENDHLSLEQAGGQVTDFILTRLLP